MIKEQLDSWKFAYLEQLKLKEKEVEHKKYIISQLEIQINSLTNKLDDSDYLFVPNTSLEVDQDTLLNLKEEKEINYIDNQRLISEIKEINEKIEEINLIEDELKSIKKNNVKTDNIDLNFLERLKMASTLVFVDPHRCKEELKKIITQLEEQVKDEKNISSNISLE